MNTKIWMLPAIGATMVVGCAGPLEQRWDDPVYRSIQSRFAEHDRNIAGIDHDEEFSVSPLDQHVFDALSVEDAVRVAIRNSPELRAAGYQVDAASGRVLQAGLYPNPSLSFGGEAIGSDGGSGGETTYVIEQEIVLGGKLDRARDVAKSDELGYRSAFVAQEFAVAADVSRAYFASVAAQERLAKRKELSKLANDLLESTVARVDAGSATRPDQLRAEVAYEQTQMELDAAGFQADAATQALVSIMGVEHDTAMALSSSFDRLPMLPTYEELVASTLKANSRMSLAHISIERARHAYKLAKAQAVPDLVVSIGPRYSDIDNESTFDVGLGIEIPLFDRNQGEIRATLAERLSASAQLQSVQLELKTEVSHAWSAYQSALARASRYENHLLPKAKETLDLTRQAYESGKVDYLRLLDAQQVVIESQISYIDTLEQLHFAVSMLNELSQSDFPWRNPQDEDQSQAEVTQK